MPAPLTSLSNNASNPPERDPGFGVYIHWPFCVAKCPYCDFNSHVRLGADAGGFDEAGFLAAYKAELRHMAGLSPGRQVNSIFFGGGTPSLMSAGLVGDLLAAVAALWPLARDVEITLEANPSSVEASRFAGYGAAGVTRVSLGVQALNDADLKRLGRLHNAREARQALDVANRYFDRVSFDMIYARPEQSVAAWQAELDDALQLAGGHVSFYQLTIEPGTVYAALFEAGKLQIPGEDHGRLLYDVTGDVCSAHGLVAYEVSNHARPGEESQHNLIYWRYGDYAGVGPGAHSRLTVDGERIGLSALRHPEDWRDRAKIRGNGIETRETIDSQAQAEEMIMMGLRLSEGVDVARLRHLTGFEIDNVELQPLMDDGFIALSEDGGSLRTTAKGRLVLNQVIFAVVSALG